MTRFPDFTGSEELRGALERLSLTIERHGPMVVAYSGGVDSGLLAYVAHAVLPGRMQAVIGVSPSLAQAEHRAAIAFLEAHGIPYRKIQTHEMADPRYRANGPDRCFYCKSELFARIEEAPESQRFPKVAYGANVDDRGDHRPGARAAGDRSVAAPLAEAGFTKKTVRAIARALALELWDKPAAPCLASRVPYHSEVSAEKLRQVETAEAVLHEIGFRVCRVRHFGEVARIELPADDHERARASGTWARLRTGILAAGFVRVELDDRGFRSGRMNDAIAAPPDA